MNLSGVTGQVSQQTLGARARRDEQCAPGHVNADRELQAVGQTDRERHAPSSELPDHLHAAAMARHGDYDARRLRSQREVIRDVMLAAADCDTWLTLNELRALTHYGEASISAQLRHLRKSENGGYDVSKQRREDAAGVGAAGDGRGECVWEYRILRVLQAGQRLPA
jgi:hypothetical protein